MLSSLITKMVERLDTAMKEKVILVREMNHRTKNNLSVLHALIFLKIDKTNDENIKTILKDVASRVNSLFLIHDKLSSTDRILNVDFQEYLLSLATQIFENLNSEDSKIKLNLEILNSIINVKYILPCGLIVNELMTNAIKYAFPDKIGSLSVIFKEEKNKNYYLSIKDSGIGLPDGFDMSNSSGIGGMLVESLVKQINGELEVKNNNGSEFVIRFKEEIQPEEGED